MDLTEHDAHNVAMAIHRAAEAAAEELVRTVTMPRGGAHIFTAALSYLERNPGEFRAMVARKVNDLAAPDPLRAAAVAAGNRYYRQPFVRARGGQ